MSKLIHIPSFILFYIFSGTTWMMIKVSIMNIYNDIMLGQVEISKESAEDYFGSFGAVVLTVLVIKWLVNERSRKDKEHKELQEKYNKELERQRDVAVKQLEENRKK